MSSTTEGSLTEGSLLRLLLDRTTAMTGWRADEVLGPRYAESARSFWGAVGRHWDEAIVHGDPHLPGPLMAMELSRPGARVVWKPGEHRHVPEIAFQDMVRVLGPASGLVPVDTWKSWQGIEAKFVESRPRTLWDLKERCHALAHLYVLIGCFGLSDLHEENVLFTGEGLAVIDAETFGVDTHPLPASAPPQLVAIKRLREAGLTLLFDTELPEPKPSPEVLEQRAEFEHREARERWEATSYVAQRKMGRYVAGSVSKAVELVAAHWDELVAIRERMTGGFARVIKQDSARLARMVPMRLDEDYVDERVEHMRGALAHSPAVQYAGIDEILDTLAQGAIPRLEAQIQGTGWIRPEPVGELILAWLREGQAAFDVRLGLEAGQITKMADFLNAGRIVTANGPAFITGDRDGIDLADLNHASSCQGLSGLSLLQWAKRACGMPLDLRTRGRSDDLVLCEVDAAILEGVSRLDPRKDVGFGLGLGGVFAYAWGRRELDAPFPELEQLLEAKANQSLAWTPVEPYDLFRGASGFAVGAARFAGRLAVAPAIDHALNAMEARGKVILEEIEAGGPWREFGWAHGVAGLTFGLHEACRVLGRASEVKGALEVFMADLLTDPTRHDLLPHQAILDREGDLCRGRGSLLAVLARTNPDLTKARGLRLPMNDAQLASLTRPRGRGACHGDASVAAALGFWPGEILDPEGRLPATSLISGVAGAAYARLAWKRGLPNICWGGRMRDPILA